MKTKIFEEYRSVKDQIAALEEMKAVLELQIFDEFDSEGVSNKETPFGHFFVMGRKTYEYTPAVTEWQAELTRLKKEEEITGKALLKKHSQYVRLVLPKGGEEK